MADTKTDQPQIDKFRDLARELGSDEDEGRFEESVRKLAKASVTPQDVSRKKAPEN